VRTGGRGVASRAHSRRCPCGGAAASSSGSALHGGRRPTAWDRRGHVPGLWGGDAPRCSPQMCWWASAGRSPCPQARSRTAVQGIEQLKSAYPESVYAPRG
jgi:hypothetical protein